MKILESVFVLVLADQSLKVQKSIQPVDNRFYFNYGGNLEDKANFNSSFKPLSNSVYEQKTLNSIYHSQ